jgi:hypothetical protein
LVRGTHRRPCTEHARQPNEVAAGKTLARALLAWMPALVSSSLMTAGSFSAIKRSRLTCGILIFTSTALNHDPKYGVA